MAGSINAKHTTAPSGGVTIKRIVPPRKRGVVSLRQMKNRAVNDAVSH